MLAFPVAMVAGLGVIFLRLWYFQVVEAPSLVERAEATRVVPVTQPAPRGLIFDRNNVPIATVRPQIVVTAIPNDVKGNPWVLDRVAKTLGAPVEKLERKLRDAEWRPYIPSPIFVGADIKAGTKIAESGEDLPGIKVDTEPMRYYSDTTSFTHVLGYVWTPNEKEEQRIKDAGRPVPEYVGKTGIERAYNDELMGNPGEEKVAMDARRHPLRVEGRDAPTAGDQLILTLDANLQKYATEVFRQSGFTGGAVVLDPSNGEILSLVSSPAFDQSIFTGGISDTELKQLNDDPRKPMINRATSGMFAPGSTFKIVTTVAAAEEGKFSPETTYFCPGGFFRNGVKLKCLGHHGAISFETALAKSCNTYFCNMGAAVGENAIRRAAAEMGLGQRSGIEIGDSTGVVPTVKWLQAVSHKKNPPWYLGDTANFSIGQGYVQTTPLQMANVAAMVANDGIAYRPHLVKAIRSPKGDEAVQMIKPEIAHKVDLPTSFWEEMRHALVGVVEHGTATRAKIPNVAWGGKTGSAEHGKGKTTHAWFVGFAPADHPKVAICVLLEDAGHGGDVAAPIAKDIVQHYLGELAKAPVKAATSASASLAPASSLAARSSTANR